MSTEKWIGGSGQGLTWGSAFGTEISGLANGNAVLSSVSIANSSNLDIFADLSWVATATITSAAPAYLGIYLYPQNNDNSTYGDGKFSSATTNAGPMSATYLVGTIALPATTSYTVAGSVTRIVLPPGTFKFGFYNQAGAAVATGTTTTVQYRTYNRSIA